MIVQSDFLTHWKTKALANRIGMEAALTALLALWTHCERRRAWEFQLTPLMLAGICDFKGEATELFDTMLAVNLIDRCADPAWFQVHEWGKVNAALVCKWVGHKGKGWFWHPRGHATGSLDPSIDTTKELALELPIVPTIGLDRIGLDRIGNPEGAAAPGELPLKDSGTLPAEDADPPKKEKGAGKKAKTPRERNALLDALAVVGGGGVEGVTRALWGESAKALADIREVCPDVTPEMIVEAAAAYRREWPKASVSPSALAKHWGKYAPGAKKEGGRAVQGVQEPTWDWRAFAAARIGYDLVLPWKATLERTRKQILDEWEKTPVDARQSFEGSEVLP